MDQAAAGILGIGGYAGNAAHVHDRIVDIDFHRIDNDHGCQSFLIEPAQHLSFFQDGTFCVFDLILLPSGLK